MSIRHKSSVNNKDFEQLRLVQNRQTAAPSVSLDKSGQPSTQPLVTPTDNPKYGCPLMPVSHWNPTSVPSKAAIIFLTFPVKCLLQAASPHRGHVILTSHARVPGYRWVFYFDVLGSRQDAQQIPQPN